jgi:sRNA-binding regulator protein Hfq
MYSLEGDVPMNGRADQSGMSGHSAPASHPEQRVHNGPPAVLPIRLQTLASREQGPNRQAEVFYLQKQIQAQIPMVIVLEDGERIEGCIEWYDGQALKVRGRTKTLIYKSAIKYMYKQGEAGR